MKRAPLVALIASGTLGLGVSLAAPDARALCLAGAAPSPCSSGGSPVAARGAQSFQSLTLSSLAVPQAVAGPAADTSALSASSGALGGTSITYTLRDRDVAPAAARGDANPAPLHRAGAPVTVMGTVGPTVRVRYQIDAGPSDAPVEGDGLQIVINSVGPVPQAGEAPPALAGGAQPLAETSRNSFRSSDDEGFSAVALLLMGAGVIVVFSGRPRGSMRAGI